MTSRLSLTKVVLALMTTGIGLSQAPSQTNEESRLQVVVNAESADAHQDLKGIVVRQHGTTLAEAYFNGDKPDTLHDVRSATKSITALLMGIAIERHYVHSLDDRIGQYLPSVRSSIGTSITIRDLLNMRSGLDSDDHNPLAVGAESRLDAAPNWTEAAFAVPLGRQPGTEYVYSSLNAFLVGAIVESATKMSLKAFAKQALFEPLGIDNLKWRHLPDGHTTGQGNLQVTTRDLAQIGELVLADGTMQGRQIVPQSWLRDSLACQVNISAVDKYADCYGYMWYSKTENVAGHEFLVHFASGNGGNKIYIVPALGMVVAITSSAYDQPYGQERSHKILLDVLSETVGPTGSPLSHASAAGPIVDPEEAAIKDTARDYIEGWYTGDAERMERALHPELAKRTVSVDSTTGRSILEQMSAMTLVQKTRRGIGPREVPPDRRREDITLLDRYQNAAVVKIVAATWVDYLEEAKVDGKWKIVNVLWEEEAKDHGRAAAQPGNTN